MAIRDELLDELLKGYEKPEDLLGEEGIIQELTKRLLERALEGEMVDHLGYAKHSPEGTGSGNSRNGHGEKTVTGKSGKMKLKVPRDRRSEFDFRGQCTSIAFLSSGDTYRFRLRLWGFPGTVYFNSFPFVRGHVPLPPSPVATADFRYMSPPPTA